MGFALGFEGTNDCPAGYTLTTDLSNANLAASFFGVESPTSTARGTSRPKGLYKWGTDFWFNTHTGAPGNPAGGAPVCIGGQYVLGTSKSNDCPGSYRPVTDKAEAQSAAAFFGAAVPQATSRANRPTGMYWWSGSSYWFNTNSATTPAAGTPVCKKCVNNCRPRLCCSLGTAGFEVVRPVIAHFMLAYRPNYASTGEVREYYKSQVLEAMKWNIDGFVLNVPFSKNNPGIGAERASAMFDAVESIPGTPKFFLCISFDSNPVGGGQVPSVQDLQRFTTFAARRNYFLVDGRPFFSTFGGTDATPWLEWKASFGGTPPFFVPQFFVGGIPRFWQNGSPRSHAVDGAFHWSAWPWLHDPNRTQRTDSQWRQAAGVDKKLMLPIAPWFNKDVGDEHWEKANLCVGAERRRRCRKVEVFGDSENKLETIFPKRWQSLVGTEESEMPMVIQIVTWNDVSECHYIGSAVDPSDPNKFAYYGNLAKRTTDMHRSNIHSGPFDMDHKAFRVMAAHYITLYKDSAGTDSTGTTAVSKVRMQDVRQFYWWYRAYRRGEGHDEHVVPHIDGVEDSIFFLIVSGSGISPTVNGHFLQRDNRAADLWSLPFQTLQPDSTKSIDINVVIGNWKIGTCSLTGWSANSSDYQGGQCNLPVRPARVVTSHDTRGENFNIFTNYLLLP